jgi:hypothetical protein
MVDDGRAPAREQLGELGLALGRPAVEQLGQALATRGDEPSSASRPASLARSRRWGLHVAEVAQLGQAPATRAASTECRSAIQGVRRAVLAHAPEDPALARGELRARRRTGARGCAAGIAPRQRRERALDLRRRVLVLGRGEGLADAGRLDRAPQRFLGQQPGGTKATAATGAQTRKTVLSASA